MIELSTNRKLGLLKRGEGNSKVADTPLLRTICFRIRKLSIKVKKALPMGIKDEWAVIPLPQ